MSLLHRLLILVLISYQSANATVSDPSRVMKSASVKSVPPEAWVAGADPSFAVNIPILTRLPAARLTVGFETIGPDSPQATRGQKEEQIYSDLSPAVVLVMTKEGFGSGTLISADGLILTNFHVVKGYQDVGVAFKPQVTAQALMPADVKTAAVIKFDPVSDLALLKVAAVPSGRKPIELGTLSEVTVGSDVHAIGHPTGEMWTYTKGLISQLRPDYEWQTGTTDIKHRASVIQTQTPINPGNSGGPLISDHEHLVGVNTFRSSGEGLNFAVAVDEVTNFLKSPATDVRQTPAAAAKSACEARLTKKQSDSKLKAYVTQIDSDCDGKTDALLVEPFDKKKPIQLWVDPDGDGSWRTVIFDDDRDGKWDRSLWDTKGDGKWHLVGIHEDGSLIPTRWEPYKA